MNTSTATTHDIARALAQTHAGMLAGEPRTDDLSTQDQAAGWDLEHAGVLHACRQLGFLEHDAQCVAGAWRQQTLRTGHFSMADWPIEPQDFGISTRTRDKAFAPCPRNLGLYAVLPDAQWVGRMAQAGVQTLQLRFKSEDPDAIRQQVRLAVQAVRGTDSLLFINDHWQIAIEEGAYGVHLGQEDMQDASLEQLRLAGLRLGLSTHGYAEMLRADAASPSYLALGAIFPTTLKRMATAPQGLSRLKAYAALMRYHPLVAIGGIDEERMPAVMQSGVGSIAVVRAITGANHPEQTAKGLKHLIENLQKTAPRSKTA
ncbi:thiamine phosphate synthase [Limnohabitans sp.]|uniref:thiamine phosphate synthase n=1 Tax=Limnohabitans sp. TaxID=1907725 RepID=UPI00334216AB